MNISQLYYFKHLAEVRHYTKTAQDLYITQPSLSNAISALEGELGVKLFTKSGRSTILTPIGQEFYIHVCHALEDLEAGIDTIKKYNNKLGGLIRVATVPTIQSDYLPELISDFTRQEAPGVEFSVNPCLTVHSIPELKNGQCDVAFCTDTEDDQIHFVPVVFQPLVAVVHNTHPLAQKKALALDELKQHRVYTYNQKHKVSAKIFELAKAHQISYVCQYDDEMLICGTLRQERDHVALVLKTPYIQQFDDLSILELPQVPKDFHIICMAFLKNGERNKVTQSFIDFVAARRSYPLDRSALSPI